MEPFVLANGLELPPVGFGTYQAAPEQDARVLRAAIDAGYRYFDTASFYGTEGALGRAIRESGVPRSEFFLATKLWKDEMGYENAKQACARSLERLGVDEVDLYLIHWPRPDLECDWRTLCRETWRALEELYYDGYARAIGVSNFLPHHLENLGEGARIFPMVDQLEFHPGYPQIEAVEFCQRCDVLPQAWSPLGRARVLSDPLLAGIAQAHGVTAAQVCLRYALQKGVMPLPKSSDPARMAQNRAVTGFALTDEQMAALDAMPQTGWSGEHPDRARTPV